MPARRPETGTGTTVTIPQEAAGLTLSNSPTAQQLSQQWSALPMPGDKSVGVYDDSSGRTRAAVLVSRVNLSVAQQGDFLRGAKVGVERSGSVDFHEVSPGPLGGHMQCAGAVGAKGTGTVCVFTDAQAIGMVDVFGSTTGDALAVQLREAVEHSS